MDALRFYLSPALRSLARAPGFALAAVLTLGLGLGACAALFTVVHAVLLRPLPYAEPNALVAWVGNQSAPDAADFGRQAPSLASVGLVGAWPAELQGPAGPERVEGALVSGGFLPTLGVSAALGRTLGEADDRPGAAPVVMVSHRLWRERLGGTPAALGQQLLLGGTGYTVVGVLPEGFSLPRGKAEVLLPLHVTYAEGAEARGAHFLLAVARLAPGASLRGAQAEVDGVAARLQQEHPAETREMRYVLQGLHARLAGPVRPALQVLSAAVALVLLVACATFAGLLLARASERQEELAVRGALGAGRGQVAAVLLTEALVLAAASAALGVLLAVWGVDVLLALAPEGVHGLASARVGAPVVGFTLVLALASGLTAAAFPSLRGTPRDTGALLRGGAGVVGAAAAGRFRQALVALQVAGTLVLCVGAGLLLRSFHAAAGAELGFTPQGLLTVRIDLPTTRYAGLPEQGRFWRELQAQVGQTPGVERAGLVSELPLSGANIDHNVIVEGAPPVPEGEEPSAGARVVSPDTLRTLQVPLQEGRWLAASDDADGPRVVLVNRSFAQWAWPGQSALGRRLRWARGEGTWLTVVGVVGDIRHGSPEREEGPSVYLPVAQEEAPWRRWSNLVVRPAPGVPAATLLPALRQAALRVDPLLALGEARAMEEVLADALAPRRFQLRLLGAFGAVALALSALGLYGLASQLVAMRRRELGVRVALGASPADVLRLVLGLGMRPVVLGTAVGLVAALLLSRGLQSLLYGVEATDPATYLTLALGLDLVAVLALLGPARRALRTSPLEVMRG